MAHNVIQKRGKLGHDGSREREREREKVLFSSMHFGAIFVHLKAKKRFLGERKRFLEKVLVVFAQRIIS